MAATLAIAYGPRVKLCVVGDDTVNPTVEVSSIFRLCLIVASAVTPPVVTPAVPEGPWARMPEPPFPRDLLLAFREYLAVKKIEDFDKRMEAYDRVRERRRSVSVDGVRDGDGKQGDEVEALVREYAHLKRQLLLGGGDKKDEEN